MNYHPVSLIPSITDRLFNDRFDRMDKLFSRLTGDVPLSDSPSYDIVQRDDTHYEITVSVPGFKESELDVSVQGGQLIINGVHEEKQEQKEGEKWLHRGISRNTINLQFNLNNKFHVQNAQLDNGLLTLQLEYQIPEEEKPKKIAIGVKNENKTKAIESSKS